VKQGYKQAKGELGWADFQVRSDVAIRRHLALVGTAFSFCWRDWFTDPPPTADAADRPTTRRERGHHNSIHSAQSSAGAALASRAECICCHHRFTRGRRRPLPPISLQNQDSECG
jgi:hypothetical protein